MKLYIDESGSTGQPVIDLTGLSNFKEQSFFCLAGILIENEGQSNLLEGFVDDLKKQYHIQSPELKAKHIYENKPKAVIDLFDKLIELDIPIFWELMDKKYYLCTQFTNVYVLPPHSLPIDNDAIVQRRNVAEVLYSILSDDLLSEFCELCLNPGKNKFEQLFEKLLSFFTETDNPGSKFLKKSVELLKEDYLEFVAENGDNAYKQFLPSPDNDKRNRVISILPNTHAFANLIARCEKYRLDTILPPFTIIHDEQDHFDEIIKTNFDAMKKTETDDLLKGTTIAEKSLYKIHDSVTISFEDSKQYK